MTNTTEFENYDTEEMWDEEFVDPTEEMGTVADLVKGAEFMHDAEPDFMYFIDLAERVPEIEEAYELKEEEQGFVTVNDVMTIHDCPFYSTFTGNIHVSNPMFRDYPGASDVVEVAYEMLKNEQ